MTLLDEIGPHGGAESIARQIAVGLDRSRFESTLCISRRKSLQGGERELAQLRDAGVSMLSLDRVSRLDVAAWGRFVAHLRKRRIDVLHAHKFGSNAWGSLVAPLGGVPVFVAHEHSWSFEDRPMRRFVDRALVARSADAFVAVSRQDMIRMHEVEGVPLRKLRFIPNGVPGPESIGEARDLRLTLGIEPGQPVIGVVATLRPEKALGVLVRAAAQLTARFPDLKVLIAGGDPVDQHGRPGAVGGEIEALARRLGVDDNVVLLGPRSDVPDVLATLDVAVLCSDFEGSPLSVMEYMRAGKPVVATRVGGLPDLVRDGTTGLLVNRRDPEALAAAIAALLDDPQRAAAMGEAGRSRGVEFSIEATTRRVEALYEELLEAKAR